MPNTDRCRRVLVDVRAPGVNMAGTPTASSVLTTRGASSATPIAAKSWTPRSQASEREAHI